MKSIYLTLVRASKSTTAYTLPSINLMKNSSSDVFCLDHTMAYQHAFGYIRQLAIHLRNSMKIKTKVCHDLFIDDLSLLFAWIHFRRHTRMFTTGSLFILSTSGVLSLDEHVT